MGHDESLEGEEPSGAERHTSPARDLRTWLAGAPLPASLELTLGLLAPMVITIAAALRVASFTIDDAYISFRYAENLANGNGLVYNVGERVEGLHELPLDGAPRRGGEARRGAGGGVEGARRRLRCRCARPDVPPLGGCVRSRTCPASRRGCSR